MEQIAHQRLDAIAQTFGIGRLERHIFLCAQQSNPRCSSYEASSAVWRYLKRRLKELGISVSLRVGALRVAPHYWSAEEEIDRLLDVLDAAPEAVAT